MKLLIYAIELIVTIANYHNSVFNNVVQTIISIITLQQCFMQITQNMYDCIEDNQYYKLFSVLIVKNTCKMFMNCNSFSQ